jgi:SNF2 family DNA or RNA helicase
MSTTQGANRAFVELNAAGDRVEVHFRYNPDFVKSIKEVPGARYTPADRGGPFWTIPLNLDILRRLRENFGNAIVVGRALNVWAKEAVKREANLHQLAATDDLPCEDLPNLMEKIPELAEWMRGYQRADVKFLAATSALNLNEQGLGKTAEIIGAIFEAGLDHGPHLVVAPKTSLETVWRYEIERWTEHLEQPPEVITFSGEWSATTRIELLTEFAACVEEDWPVWFVCTPQTLLAEESDRLKNPNTIEARRMLRSVVFDTEWNTFTIDEYHKTGLPNAGGKKGSGTKFSDTVKDIKSQRRYAITGTPMGGRPIKLWGALHFLYPKQYTSKWAWADTWLQVNSNGFGKDIGGIQPGREADFYKSLAPYVVRRLKSEVLPQLPPKQYVDVWCEMTPKQAKQYNAMADAAELLIDEQRLNAMGVLAQYTRLKVFADAYCDEVIESMIRCSRCGGEGTISDLDDPNLQERVDCPKCEGKGEVKHLHPVPTTESGKLPYLLERLEEAGIDPDDPAGDACAVVASQFKDVVDMIHEWLNSKGIPSVKITGDVSGSDRADIQRRFQAGGKDAPRVVVMTTTAGGVSITLDRADTVHIMDETWVPDDQEQLEDRIHRASRMHQVTCYYYRSKDTIEQQIQETNVDKRNINKSILDVRRQGFRANVRAKAAA